MRDIIKKSAALTLALAIVLISMFWVSCGSCFAMTDAPKVNDYAGLMTGEDSDRLEAYLDEMSEKLQFDVILLTTNDTGSRTAAEYADDFYDSNGYGYGEYYDGCIMIVDLGEGTYVMTTCGNGIYYLSDSDIESVYDSFYDVYSDENASWYDVFALGYADKVKEIVLDSQDYYGDINPYDNF